MSVHCYRVYAPADYQAANACGCSCQTVTERGDQAVPECGGEASNGFAEHVSRSVACGPRAARGMARKRQSGGGIGQLPQILALLQLGGQPLVQIRRSDVRCGRRRLAPSDRGCRSVEPHFSLRWYAVCCRLRWLVCSCLLVRCHDEAPSQTTSGISAQHVWHWASMAPL